VENFFSPDAFLNALGTELSLTIMDLFLEMRPPVQIGSLFFAAGFSRRSIRRSQMFDVAGVIFIILGRPIDCLLYLSNGPLSANNVTIPIASNMKSQAT